MIRDFRCEGQDVITERSLVDGKISSPSESPILDLQTVDVSRLQRRIADARFWDGEVQKEDLVWSMLEEGYKNDFVVALLDQCDDVYVAAFATQLSAARIQTCVGRQMPVTLLRAMLPPTLAAASGLHARAIHVALRDCHPKAHSPEKHETFAPHVDLMPQDYEAHVEEVMKQFENVIQKDVRLAGAVTSLRTSSWSMRAAVKRIGMLIKEHSFWASFELFATEVPSLRRTGSIMSYGDRFLRVSTYWSSSCDGSEDSPVQLQRSQAPRSFISAYAGSGTEVTTPLLRSRW